MKTIIDLLNEYKIEVLTERFPKNMKWYMLLPFLKWFEQIEIFCRINEEIVRP